MSVTHSNEITTAAKKIARWLSDRSKSSAPPPTTRDIIDRIHALFPAPKFSSEDQIGIGRAALAVFKKNDPDAHSRFEAQLADIAI